MGVQQDVVVKEQGFLQNLKNFLLTGVGGLQDLGSPIQPRVEQALKEYGNDRMSALDRLLNTKEGAKELASAFAGGALGITKIIGRIPTAGPLGSPNSRYGQGGKRERLGGGAGGEG